MYIRFKKDGRRDLCDGWLGKPYVHIVDVDFNRLRFLHMNAQHLKTYINTCETQISAERNTTKTTTA